MSKYIVIHDNETVKHIDEIGHDFTKENVEVVAQTPTYVPQEGKYGVLEWDETEGLVYRYYDIPETSEDGEVLTAESTKLNNY